jgi:hypothetical protein
LLSCSKEFAKISQSVQKFTGIDSQLLAKKGSGTVDDDLIETDMAIFEEEKRTDFKYLECWHLLKNHEKFCPMISLCSDSLSSS